MYYGPLIMQTSILLFEEKNIKLKSIGESSQKGPCIMCNILCIGITGKVTDNCGCFILYIIIFSILLISILLLARY